MLPRMCGQAPSIKPFLVILSLAWEVQAFAEQAATELLEATQSEVTQPFRQEERRQGQLSGSNVARVAKMS